MKSSLKSPWVRRLLLAQSVGVKGSFFRDLGINILYVTRDDRVDSETPGTTLTKLVGDTSVSSTRP